ncbi:CHAT domain-containing protein [Ephemerocybe angulata]|uniref:CHAT domain-containing protein n=1 Tax=Ephemerocybe angulata TaxID=980116 RepID=A0A8H6H7K2_9AGAR|nr:CHAT domain-containing protein [Tulosesus angulatus]
MAHVNPEMERKESMAQSLNGRGFALHHHFQRTGDLRDITEGIEDLRRSLELTPKGHVKMPIRLGDLGDALYSLFRHTGEPHDLTEAVSLHRSALEVTPNGDSDMPSRLNGLAASLGSLFKLTGDLQHLREAIVNLRRAVELIPEDDYDTPTFYSNLGEFIHSLFKHTGDLQDLTEAISMHRKAVNLTHDGDSDMHFWLNGLGSAQDSLFERTGDLSHDLAEAILTRRRALELTPNGHPALPTRLNNLALSLEYLYHGTGNLRDITEAIYLQRRAVELTPDGHADTPLWLNNLGGFLESRFQRTEDLQDITEAVSIQRRAVELTPHGHLSEDLQDVNEAIMTQRKALELTPEGHSSIPGHLTTLGSSLQSRFQCTGDLSDLTEAVSINRRAVELTPEGHAHMPGRLNNLGASLDSLFKRTGEVQHLAEAILNRRKAAELTPSGHAGMPSSLNNLGKSLESLFEHTGDCHARDEAISFYQSSATYTSGSPHTRLRAARNWIQSLNRYHPSSPDILSAFDTAIHLITLTATLEQTLHRRYTELQYSSGLPLQAASTAFTHHRVDKALEWLEQGRCLVWGQLTNLRRPLDDLRDHHSHLSDSVMEVSRQLELAGSSRVMPRAGMSLSEKRSLDEQARDNFDLAQRWDNLLDKVRALPGFETFLKPLPWYTLLQHLPESGYVVVINVDEQRCDAIAMRAGQDQPLHIALPDFSLERCEQYRKDLLVQLQSYNLLDRGRADVTESEEGGMKRSIQSVSLRGKRGEPVIQAILRGLWKTVVKPILQRLEVSRIDRSSPLAPPRIWWCPAGPLSFLPIHAAGIYGPNGSESILDYAVSSYTPTIASLIDRVKKGHAIEKSSSGLFMTSQPNASGASSIPGTTKEIRSIYEIATKRGLRVEKLEGGEITAAGCLDIMETFSSVHLACHASQNAENPLASHFIFHDGSLDLASILQRNLKSADFAFLSACQTCTGAQKLPDEAVHLAAGMLAAGYRRVVATMWSIGDRHAPDVAADFYRYLLDHQDPDSEDGFDGRHSAHALHHAVEQLRLRLDDDSSDQSLLTWIPYVHFGY